jgi:hypothetical protein
MQKFVTKSLLVFGVIAHVPAYAGLITGPQEVIYEGNILDNTGAPINGGNYDFRFSLWNAQNVDSADISIGSINNTAPNFLGWKELQTKTLSPQGYFANELGAVSSLPVDIFENNGSYLQVEVKSAGTANTSFELMDFDGTTAGDQRMPVSSVPYAIESDKVDGHHVGNAADEIAVLNTAGQFDEALISNQINADSFTLDLNQDATNINLQFGGSLINVLSFDVANDWFNFSNDVNIQGDLTTSGTINGVNIGPVAQTTVLSPFFTAGVFHADGNDNSGSMFEEIETINGDKKNTVQWKTKKNTLQDYDLTVRYKLPNTFVSFDGASPISLQLETQGTITESKIDFTIEKETLATDQLQNAGTDLVTNVWTTQNFALDPSTTWTPGETMLLKIKLSATSGYTPKISNISIATIH